MLDIYPPMLCSHSTAAQGRTGINLEALMDTGDWMLDLKLDGVRVLAHWDPATGLTLANRVGVVVNRRFPEIVAALTGVLEGTRKPLLIDGEVVARDGSFESTLLRDKQENPAAIRRLVQSNPVSFIAFDVPNPKFAEPWSERRARLERLHGGWRQSIFAASLGITVVSDSYEFFASTRELGMEGVVAKRINARYEFGKRSRNWIKARHTFSVTALAIGYTPGTGSRAHFGAMRLVMLDKGEPVEVGRVGTGFTEREIKHLKLALDRGEMLPVEIRCANVTRDRQLRFPVYSHVRTDVGPEAFNIEQLEHLPVC